MSCDPAAAQTAATTLGAPWQGRSEAFAIPSLHKVQTSKAGRASGPVLQLAVLDAPGPADAAVGGQGALQLDARVGHLHVVVHGLPLLGHQAEGRHGDLWSRTH